MPDNLELLSVQSEVLVETDSVLLVICSFSKVQCKL